MCILYVYTLLKIVGYYGSVHVSDEFPNKKNVDVGRWVGWALSTFSKKKLF